MHRRKFGGTAGDEFGGTVSYELDRFAGNELNGTADDEVPDRQAREPGQLRRRSARVVGARGESVPEGAARELVAHERIRARNDPRANGAARGPSGVSTERRAGGAARGRSGAARGPDGCQCLKPWPTMKHGWRPASGVRGRRARRGMHVCGSHAHDATMPMPPLPLDPHPHLWTLDSVAYCSCASLRARTGQRVPDCSRANVFLVRSPVGLVCACQPVLC